MNKKIRIIIVFFLFIAVFFSRFTNVKAEDEIYLYYADESEIFHNGLDGIYIDIYSSPYSETWENGNPYGPQGSTWFVGARVRQLTEKGEFTVHTPSEWMTTYGESLEFTTGDTPQDYSIICWNNHVAFLERIEGTTAYISEGGGPNSLSRCGYTRIFSCNVDEITGLNADFLGYVYTNPGICPTGTVDSILGGVGQVTVRGWAFDRDDISEPLDIHVYIGGPAGSEEAEGNSLTKANLKRDDVNNVFGTGVNHGFQNTITTQKVGRQPVYIYAINVGTGRNILIGRRNVDIEYANPQGWIDNVAGGNGQINIKGWVYDRSDISSALNMKVYIGDPELETSECYDIVANKERTDVNNEFGIGSNHGFEETIKTSKRGEQSINLYAINVGNGENVLLGGNTVTIEDAVRPRNDLSENGIIDQQDVLMLLRFIAYSNSTIVSQKHPEWNLDSNKIEMADVDGDGVVKSSDSLILLRYIAASTSSEIAQKHPDWLNIQ